MKINIRLIIAILSVIAFSVLPRVRAGQYFQDFSAFNVGDTSLGDVAEVTDSTHKELGLTEVGSNNVTSAFELPDLDPRTPAYAFSVKWNSQVYGNFPNAADGFSFNFGQLSSLNLTSENLDRLKSR